MKTLIVGGGLSGLALADHLATMGEEFLVLEARDRFGGRIMTQQHGEAFFDMGPAWFWPGQPRIAKLIERFGLTRFDQYSSGDLLFEDEEGQVQRGRGYASMAGSWRLEGGLDTLTSTLAQTIPDSAKQLRAKVTSINFTGGACSATLADGTTIAGDQVVLALPPRLASEIGFSPQLPDTSVAALSNIPTWMAAQSKVVAVYESPFWRNAGLSGDAMSHIGPMVEIHDASPSSGDVYGLFGFVGVPSLGRTNPLALREAAEKQLIRLFGNAAANPIALFIKDWAADPLTSTALDTQPQRSHPAYGRPAALRGLWDNRLIFAGTEVASRFGGYIEGALEAAEEAAGFLQQNARARNH